MSILRLPRNSPWPNHLVTSNLSEAHWVRNGELLGKDWVWAKMKGNLKWEPLNPFCLQNIRCTCMIRNQGISNKANLRDLIAATGQVISNWIQIVNFSARVTVKFDGWPRKTIGHFFYAMSSFVHHFKSIGEFKLDLQSRNAQFGSKWVICYPVWPWNLMDDLGKQ